MRLIGTAGHIDHGKSTLVQALTGTHPSRLPEEHARGMTIDLGYAHLDHPDGYKLGVVDVPGHEKLVKNMVAGATGFELALWVVDAREGVMPQSREHLQILELLGVRALVPVVTKVGLATADQIAATRQGVAALVGRGRVPARRVHAVDSVSGLGITELRDEIFALCRGDAVPDGGALPYLAVDRVFSRKGIGTVVTGTLMRGRLAEGDTVALSSQSGTWRVRSLNHHHARTAAIGAGHRVGVNLAGLEVGGVRRGDVLAAPDYPYTGRFLNVRLEWVEREVPPVKHGMRLLFHAGCTEVECRLWGVEGAEGEGTATWAQVELPQPAHFFPGQRFILRNASPLMTIGGGEVLDLAPDRARRVTPAERLAYALWGRGEPWLGAHAAAAGAWAFDLTALARRWMRPVAELHQQAQADPTLRTGTPTAKHPSPPLLWRAERGAELLERLQGFVARQPRSEQTIPYAQLARELKAGATGLRPPLLRPLLPYLLDTDGPAAAFLRAHTRTDKGGLLLYPGKASLTPDEQQVADAVLRRLQAQGLRPSRVPEYRDAGPHQPQVVERVLAKLREAGLVVRVSPDLVLHATAAAELRRAPDRYRIDGVRAAEFGEALGLSRKYGIPYLEYLNREGILRREGDRHYRTARPVT